MTVCLFVSFSLCLLLAECWSVSARIWLADWSSSSTEANSAAQQTRDLAIYGGLGFSQAVFVLLACFIQAVGSVMASRRLHRGLLLNILHSPMAFFETTPLGRIVNRFSKDMDTVDTLAPRSFINFLRSTLEMFAVIFIISFATPLFLSVILPLAVLYIFIQVKYSIYGCILYIQWFKVVFKLTVDGNYSCFAIILHLLSWSIVQSGAGPKQIITWPTRTLPRLPSSSDAVIRSIVIGQKW